jgi:arabinogalactan oligomer/maltooligosaccharide transport system substrate-binding protein
MKKPVILVSSIIFLLATFLFVFAANDGFRKCDLEQDTVCFDKDLKHYSIEENAVLTLEVNTLEYGEAIKSLWSTLHPEANPLNIVLTNEAVSDVMILNQNDAAIHYDELLVLDTNIENKRSTISSELNFEGLRFLPISGEGFAFITNKTELEQIVGSWTDTNSNSIHDSFETYESIINAQANWQTDKRKLVLSLSEPYTLYPLFTSHGWKLFNDYSSYYPGFDDEKFVESLQFIETLSTVNWNGSENNEASSYTWDFPNVLFDDNFVFSQVATWMFVEEMDIKHESEWVISSFPKAFNSSESSLHPMLTEVLGYSINSATLYPSAAHELIRIMYTVEGLQAKVNTDHRVILSDKTTLDELNFINPIQKQFAYAFLESESEPLSAVEDYPNILAIKLFYEIDLESTIQRLWNKEITVKEAQIELALKSDQWIIKNSKLFEGKINHE